MSVGTILTSDGCRLSYEVVGEGVPVLWQHGLGATRAQPAEVFPHHAGLRRITLECRGHGESELGDANKLTIEQFADDALVLLDHLGLPRLAAGGISLGAAVALRLAAFHGERISGLILARPAWVDQPAPETQNSYPAAAHFLEQFDPEEGLRRFCETPVFQSLLAASPDNANSLAGFFSRPRPETTIALLSRIPNDGPGVPRQALERLDLPTLIVGNEQDHVHPMAYAQELSRLIPGARLRQITSKSVDRGAYVTEFRDALSAFLLARGETE
jgi:pimeloyl-ACP methyl ester carboxylesterase